MMGEIASRNKARYDCVFGEVMKSREGRGWIYVKVIGSDSVSFLCRGFWFSWLLNVEGAVLVSPCADAGIEEGWHWNSKSTSTVSFASMLAGSCALLMVAIESIPCSFAWVGSLGVLSPRFLAPSSSDMLLAVV
jgi:hypothetical protein